MDFDSQKRPSASKIWDILEEWNKSIESSDSVNEIKKQFIEADKVIKSLPISKHPDEMSTSKIISTKLISKAIKDLSQAQADSAK
ncbi:hypothetical protein F8M41_000904 [Gigaspora margarita]|uniref:Uncharacterized protein n=1 Tax=Gigaspora margarita TaxID=4874 RepID=A0A8H4A9G5_GIGMA|nr:hypothetical protein F8M41_000904 [Gigaspora margarita]